MTLTQKIIPLFEPIFTLMNRPVFLLLVLLGLATACSQLTEEIVIHPDGSGEYALYTDLIPSMKGMMAGFMAMTAGDSLTEADIDKRVEDMLWKDFGTEVDSVFQLDNKLPENSEVTPAQQEILSRVQGFMKGTREQGEILSGMRYSWKNQKDFQTFMNLLEESQQGQAGAGMGKSSSKITLTKNSFERTSRQIEKPDFENSMEAQMMKGMMRDMKVRTVVKLPGKIKKVSGKTVVNKSGQTVILEYNLLDYMEGKVNTDFKVEFD
jgi:hypothetical protein